MDQHGRLKDRPEPNLFYREHDGQVVLNIHRGEASQVENKAIFDQLFAKKEEIEHDFGEPLGWQRLDAKRASRIRKVIYLGGYLDQERWPEVKDAMIDAMIRLNHALKRNIDTLEI